MDVSRVGRNLLFAFIILLIVGSIDRADLPMTQRIEEYIAFVLTTDFDYESWIERAQGMDWFPDDFRWRRFVPWLNEETQAVSAPVEESAAGSR